MSLTVDVGLRLVKDVHEFVGDRAEAGRLLSETSNLPESQEFIGSLSITRLAAGQLITKQFYDIGHMLEMTSSADREIASRIGGLTLLLTDTVDDQVDNSKMPIGEKFRYMDQGIACLAEGVQPRVHEYPSTMETAAARATFDIASYIHQLVSSRHGEEVFGATMSKLVDDVRQQFHETDVEEQLELTKRIGYGCGLIMASAVQIVTKESDPQIASASKGIGAYAEFMDNAYEIGDDIADGVVNYATVYMDHYGYSPRNARVVKEKLLESATGELEQGKSGLSNEQLVIYAAAQKLISLRYRVIQQGLNVVSSPRHIYRIKSLQYAQA